MARPSRGHNREDTGASRVVSPHRRVMAFFDLVMDAFRREEESEKRERRIQEWRCVAWLGGLRCGNTLG